MRGNWMASIVMAVAACGVVVADDVKSGPQVGEQVGAFNVKDITGPSQGKSLCYRCQYGNRPTVSIFARDVTDELAKLVQDLDQQVAKNKDQQMAAFVVVLAEDEEAIAPKLQKLAQEKGIKNVPLTVYDGESGPGGYKIAKDADVTVVMWKQGEVKANQAFKKGELDSGKAEKVAGETTKILK